MNRQLVTSAILAILILSVNLSLYTSEKGFGLSLPPPISVRQIQLLDTLGQEITYVEAGEQSSVRVVLLSNSDVAQPFVVLVEVRDGVGITQYLSWQSGKLAVGGNYTFETSWMPQSGCLSRYIECEPDSQIRAFAISDLDNPQVLSAVQSLQGITVADPSEHVDKVYTFERDGNEYEIEYSIDGGYIKNIETKEPFPTMTISMGEVIKDTELTLRFGTDLAFVTFACGRDWGVENIEVFVDTIPSLRTISEDSAIITLHISPVIRGTEEIEIVGMCPL